jgi:hypothetical protein
MTPIVEAPGIKNETVTASQESGIPRRWGMLWSLFFFVTGTAPLFLPHQAWAGAWTQPRGGYYTKVEVAGLSTDEQFDAEGNRVEYAADAARIRTAVYSNRQVRAYGEYGFTPWLTGVASMAYQRLEVEEKAIRRRTNGLSDLRLGGRVRLSRTLPVAAAAFEVKIPTGYDKSDFPSLGSNTVDLSLLLQAGTSFKVGYLTAEAGYSFRMGCLANEIPFSAELGVNPLPRTQLRAVLRGRRAVDPETTGTCSVEFDPLLADARAYEVRGVVVYSFVKEIDAEASISNAFAGRSSLAGTEVSIGLAWHR